jgi:hypothetical protein
MENKNFDLSMQEALERLKVLGADIDLDYYKIPVENTDLVSIEQEIPKKTKVTSKHTIIVDSRQRDYELYPSANNYYISLFEPQKNVERIELIAAMLPKTEYNVTTDNNLLIVTVNGITKQVYLTPGQYVLGSNVYGSIDYLSSGDTLQTWGLLGEVKRSLNNSFSNFDIFLATAPAPNDPLAPSSGTGINAAVLNRVVITNSSDSFSIDFRNAGYKNGSPYRLLGFQKKIINSTINNYIYGSSDTGQCSTTDLESGTTWNISINSVIATYDYDLLDDPKYATLEIEFGNTLGERLESRDITNNRKFAVIIYDANEPDNIQTYNVNGETSNVKARFDRKMGRLKALKGSDFDKKIITFSPPIYLDNFKISFYKYDNTYYDFHNREHMLTFELDVADYDPTYRY